jgi:hypothetical protein
MKNEGSTPTNIVSLKSDVRSSLRDLACILASA